MRTTSVLASVFIAAAAQAPAGSIPNTLYVERLFEGGGSTSQIIVDDTTAYLLESSGMAAIDLSVFDSWAVVDRVAFPRARSAVIRNGTTLLAYGDGAEVIANPSPGSIERRYGISVSGIIEEAVPFGSGFVFLCWTPESGDVATYIDPEPDGGSLAHVGSINELIGSAGTYLYAFDNVGAGVFQYDPEKEALTRAGDFPLPSGWSEQTVFAPSQLGGRLYARHRVAGRRDGSIGGWDLADPAAPKLLGSTNSFGGLIDITSGALSLEDGGMRFTGAFALQTGGASEQAVVRQYSGANFPTLQVLQENGAVTGSYELVAAGSNERVAYRDDDGRVRFAEAGQVEAERRYSGNMGQGAISFSGKLLASDSSVSVADPARPTEAPIEGLIAFDPLTSRVERVAAGDGERVLTVEWVRREVGLFFETVPAALRVRAVHGAHTAVETEFAPPAPFLVGDNATFFMSDGRVFMNAYRSAADESERFQTIQLIDARTPGAPVSCEFLPPSGMWEGPLDLAVASGNHAFAGVAGKIYAWDISEMESPTPLGTYELPAAQFYSGFAGARGDTLFAIFGASDAARIESCSACPFWRYYGVSISFSGVPTVVGSFLPVSEDAARGSMRSTFHDPYWIFSSGNGLTAVSVLQIVDTTNPADLAIAYEEFSGAAEAGSNDLKSRGGLIADVRATGALRISRLHRTERQALALNQVLGTADAQVPNDTNTDGIVCVADLVTESLP